jgi:hypothetical protein
LGGHNLSLNKPPGGSNLPEVDWMFL